MMNLETRKKEKESKKESRSPEILLNWLILCSWLNVRSKWLWWAGRLWTEWMIISRYIIRDDRRCNKRVRQSQLRFIIIRWMKSVVVFIIISKLSILGLGQMLHRLLSSFLRQTSWLSIGTKMKSRRSVASSSPSLFRNTREKYTTRDDDGHEEDDHPHHHRHNKKERYGDDETWKDSWRELRSTEIYIPHSSF